ncbi:rab15 effector protein [Salarias fasciatus]|uniref:rab15 effector protein n=1 Tax=Salarias fasciatus TaxID=181472 RepID=UPI001176F47D|nr:rab15 effector protein [Salarias fasciatus]
MGLKFSQPPSSPFKAPGFLSSFRRASSRQPSFNPPLQSLHPSIFSTLRRPPAVKPGDFIPLFSDCVSAASSRTQEYLGFQDPEDKFHPSPETLTQIFLMTYISRSVSLNMADAFSCTAMTPEQRVLLGADWVWALLEKPTKTPKVQIAVQVLHLPRRKEAEPTEAPSSDSRSESVQMARLEGGHRSVQERLVDFCSSVGKDCYALFLFFGRKNDRENVYGVLSNNFEAAVGKCSKIDRTLIENFFKGSRYLHTPSGMMQAIVTKKKDDPLTLMVKFS